jgi:hypothetical protein
MDGKARGCRRSRAWNRAQWRSHVTAQAGSGLTIEDYCVAHGLKRRTFHHWRRRFNVEEEACEGVGGEATGQCKPVFAEVLVNASELPQPKAVIEVVLRGERRLRVGVGCDEEALRRLVAVLESVPC